ncbi:MAG: hypothetical protein AB8E15_04135 [Bdellovibrionales bacterium]
MSNKEIFEHFVLKHKQITDQEIGDYRRKLLLYLNRFKTEVQNPPQDLLVFLAKWSEELNSEYEHDLDTAILKTGSALEEIDSILN